MSPNSDGGLTAMEEFSYAVGMSQDERVIVGDVPS